MPSSPKQYAPFPKPDGIGELKITHTTGELKIKTISI